MTEQILIERSEVYYRLKFKGRYFQNKPIFKYCQKLTIRQKRISGSIFMGNRWPLK